MNRSSWADWPTRNSLSPSHSCIKHRSGVLDVLKGNYADAMNTLSDANSRELAVQASLALMHDVDAAWIYFKLGRIDEAKASFQLAKDGPVARLDADDAAVYWKRMSLLDSELSDGLSSAEYSIKSRDALNLFYEELSDLESAIVEFK